MSMPGIERAVGEVLAALRDGMAAKLASYVSEYADGIEPPAPAAEAFWKHLPRPIPDYPAIIVQALPENEQDPNTGREYECAFQIQVDVITRAGDIDETDVHLWRYWRAIKEILCPADALTCGDCVVKSIDHSAPIVTDPASGDELRDIPGLFVITTYEIA